MKYYLFLILLFSSCLACKAPEEHSPDLPPAGEPTSEAELLILGTFHFHNPGADYVKNEVADIISAEKQTEIAALNERLAAFQPTKIALEKMQPENERIQREYQAYRQDSFRLTVNEIYQVGFRLADRFAHSTVYLIDYPGGMNIDSVMSFAEEHQPKIFQQLNTDLQTFLTEMNRMQKENTILEILQMMNEPASLSFAQSIYVDMAAVGQGDNYIGADVTADWYRRNLKMFANIQRIAEPGDRILLIVGQGHKPILEQLAKESTSLRYVDVMDYLELGGYETQ